MWLFDRRRDVLRVGRNSVELWSRSNHGLVLAGQHAMSAVPFDAAALEAAVAQLLQQLRSTASSARGIDVVLESAWAPVLPIEPGPTLLSRAAVEALLRHRMQTVYGSLMDGAKWDLRVDHRAGDRSGLGFAMSSDVRAALLQAANVADRSVKSIQPALAWGRAQLGRSLPRNGWLLWLEVDRTLVAWMRGGRVLALNAAAAPVGTPQQVQRCIEIEAVRQGVENDEVAIVAAGWREPPALVASSGLSWLSVGPVDTGAVVAQPVEQAA